MSISPALRYVKSNDSVVGFQDFGFREETKSVDVANLLLVFMLRGNYRSWKQPIAYFLVSHSVTPDTLLRIIMRVLSELHDTGIEVRF